MKAVSCNQGQLSLVDTPDLVPGQGHVLLDVLRCGICGSDLHARSHCGHWGALLAKTGFSGFMQADQHVVMGHEYCGEILEFGSGCDKKLKVGTRVCAMPLLHWQGSYDLQGFSQRSLGAFAEQVLSQESLMMPIPNGLSNDMAALTEPMAVALHAVNRAQIKPKELAIVLGCGPVGLAVICCLKALGTKYIVASDFSKKRRQLALQCGADVVIDPSVESPYQDWNDFGFVRGSDDLFGSLFEAKKGIDKLPLPWWHTWNIADKLGATAPKRPVVFECVGVPGMLQNILEGAPMFTRVVVVGVCMEQDNLEPTLAINKEIDLRFVLGYSPLEYRNALHLLADGKLDAQALITGTVGLAGVAQAFEALGTPEQHAKILIDPKSAVTALA